MSSILADTMARAFPLFQHRWPETSRSMGYITGVSLIAPEQVQQQETFWTSLVDAIRSGDYRPFITLVQQENTNRFHAQGVGVPSEHRQYIAYAQATLMVECVREAFDGSPAELPDLMREMEKVSEIFVNAVTNGAQGAPSAPDTRSPAAIVAAVDRAATVVRFVTTCYMPGQTISSAEDNDHIFSIIRSGRVRLYEALPDGRMITLSVLGVGDVFGALQPGKDADERRRVHAESMTDTSLTLIHESALQTLMAHAPAVAGPIIASLSAQLRDLHVLIEHVLARDTSVRLVAIILKLAEAFGAPSEGGMTVIEFPITHQELAHMIGSNRVTVTRKLLEFQKERLIVPERRNTIAVDVQGLKERVEGL